MILYRGEGGRSPGLLNSHFEKLGLDKWIPLAFRFALSEGGKSEAIPRCGLINGSSADVLSAANVARETMLSNEGGLCSTAHFAHDATQTNISHTKSNSKPRHENRTLRNSMVLRHRTINCKIDLQVLKKARAKRRNQKTVSVEGSSVTTMLQVLNIATLTKACPAQHQDHIRHITDTWIYLAMETSNT